jgi:hypothetical protein
MTDKYADALLRQVQWLFVFGSVVLLLIFAVSYFWIGSKNYSSPDQVHLRLIQSFVMAVTTNLIPVFLVFVGSYFLLRRIQQIQSEHDREALSLAIANAVRADLSDSIRASGVHDVFRRFYTDVPWDKLLPGTTDLDVIVSYARTWKNTHREQLKEIAKNERARIRVVLANPDNPQLMVELAYRYALTQDEITSCVRESLTDFKSLLASGCAECYIHVSDRPCLYTYYRLNDVVLLSLFPNTKAKTDRPGFILRGAGTLSKFLREDFESYFQSSQAVVKKEKGQDKEKIREQHQQED